MKKSWILWSCISVSAWAQSEQVVGPRPLSDVADRLQSAWARPVTYEEPVWRHPSDGSTEGDLLLHWIGPRKRTATLPLAALKSRGRGEDSGHLRGIISAFNAGNAPLRFDVIESTWGFHIVPTRSRDARGGDSAVTSLLDEYIAVIPEKRTPFKHVEALARALSIRAGIRVEASTPLLGFSFYRLYAPSDTGSAFEWGTAGVVKAREALLELLTKSATTFTWRFNCQPGSSSSTAFCVLNVAPIQLETRGPRGQVHILEWDRCVRCKPLRVPPARN